MIYSNSNLLKKFQNAVRLYELELNHVKSCAREFISEDELEKICSHPKTAHIKYWIIIERQLRKSRDGSELLAILKRRRKYTEEKWQVGE